ncbi:hypothetical protein MHH56_04950 [Paenibacillus sp. FSL K6-3182]|uniref:hypothetical protein n=1 Tax=Paenibacillus sp. FSL K6-3182 TaxID=2921495 RepID=UPI0030D41E27
MTAKSSRRTVNYGFPQADRAKFVWAMAKIDIPANATVTKLKLSIETVLDTQNLLANKEILAR